MKTFFRQLFNRSSIPQATVLMYHRIGEAVSDVWDIAVSASNFEEQLQVLKSTGRVISLPELVAGMHQKNMKPNRIALTFDDGYVDNFLTAKPLLEHYQIPATFFITSVNLGQHQEFWWDELEHLFLFTEQLPAYFSLKIQDTLLEYNLSGEAFLQEEQKRKHRKWKAFVQEPPTVRAQLFLDVWCHLRPLPAAEQQAQLQKIRDWLGVKPEVRAAYKSMTIKQLQELAQSDFCTIGAHTHNHAALAAHNRAYQTSELLENQRFLKETTGQEVNLLAYPYGNYNEDTFYAAADLHFYAGFTTEAQTVKPDLHPYGLGRFQVKNMNGAEFQNQLLTWESNS